MQLQLLWNLQELDLSIRDLQSKIEEAPALSGVEEAREYLENLKDDQAQREALLKTDRKQLKQLELEEQSLIDRRKALSDDMYGGKITNVKELEQMQRKMDLLAAEKKKLEENIINLMEEVENQEAELQEQAETIDKAIRDLQDKEQLLKEKLEQFDRELKELQVQRDELTGQIDKKYLDKYRQLVDKHQGKALALVVDDICGGCRVFISSAHRGHLYNPSSMVYCENCGRLLVKLDDQ